MRTESPVVVDGKTVAIGAVAKIIKTDSKGIAQTAADVLPYGTYEIAEKDPSTGYLLNNEWKQMFEIRNYSSYLRKMALDGYCIQLDIPEIKKMISLLGRCSNNLNQYARKANQTGSIYWADIQNLKERLNEIYDMAEKILVRLNALQG